MGEVRKGQIEGPGGLQLFELYTESALGQRSLVCALGQPSGHVPKASSTVHIHPPGESNQGP